MSRRPSDFTRTRATRTPSTRDPLGKAALFSEPASVTDISAGAAKTATHSSATRSDHPSGTSGSAGPAAASGRGASHLFSQAEPRTATVVVDCAGCGRRTRVTYAEFAALHLPVWLWIPVPGRTHRHWLRCPACHRFAWLRARWLE